MKALWSICTVISKPSLLVKALAMNKKVEASSISGSASVRQLPKKASCSTMALLPSTKYTTESNPNVVVSLR